MYQYTRRNNPEDLNLQQDPCENLQPHISWVVNTLAHRFTGRKFPSWQPHVLHEMADEGARCNQSEQVAFSSRGPGFLSVLGDRMSSQRSFMLSLCSCRHAQRQYWNIKLTIILVQFFLKREKRLMILPHCVYVCMWRIWHNWQVFTKLALNMRHCRPSALLGLWCSTFGNNKLAWS